MKNWGVFRGGSGWGSQVGCERRIEFFVKIQKKKKFFLGGRVGGGGSGGPGGVGLGGEVRVDVNEELKSFWENSQKKFRGWVSVWGGGGGQGGCE